jgi:fibronectin type 3 domain-containing protein
MYTKRRLSFILLILICFTAVTQLHAQLKDSARIAVTGRARQNSILLRWGMSTSRAWKQGNQYGFELSRYTVTRNGKLLPTPELRIMNTQPIRPKPLNDWEHIVQQDPYAAIIAQALYGKDFEISGGGDKGIASIVAQSAEQEQRFSLSLYAADNSFEAAVMAGWGWEDKEALPNEKYLYRVKSLAPQGGVAVDSAGVFIGIQDYAPLPVPGDVGAVFGDKQVALSWDYSLLKHYYTSWIVEHSKDGGKTFTPARSLPVTNLNEKEGKPSPRMYFIDSLEDNNTVYQFRVRGISAFGEKGPPSAATSGKGRHVLIYVPNIRSNQISAAGKMTLTWDFETAGNTIIKGFALNQAARENGPYKTVLTNIAPDQRSLQYDQLLPSNYFTITAVAREGESTSSFPVLVQPVDSTPPAAPIGLAGSIDSNGVVTLTWKANTEKDMFGYKVFRAGRLNEELSPLVDSIYMNAVYKDTVPIKFLNRKVYYAVAALDKRYNQSGYSVILELKRPDVVPPTSPVFSAYKVEDGQVKLSWVNCGDEDVAAHLLYRKARADTSRKWVLLQTFRDGTQYYADQFTEGGQTYTYILMAKDSSGLESPPTQPITVTVPSDPNGISIKTLNAYVNREQRYIELSWKDNNAGINEYQLYKGAGDQPLSLWKVVPASVKMVVDESLKINTVYEYGVRAVNKNGLSGPLKKVKTSY